MTGCARRAHDRVAVAEPELDDVDLLLDDRRRVDRALPHRAHRHPAAARLVAREARLVGEQHRRAPARRGGTRSSSRPARRRRRRRRNASQVGGYNPRSLKGVCPSGQRERAVNPSAQPTEVRILPPPLMNATRRPRRHSWTPCWTRERREHPGSTARVTSPTRASSRTGSSSPLRHADDRVRLAELDRVRRRQGLDDARSSRPDAQVSDTA